MAAGQVEGPPNTKPRSRCSGTSAGRGSARSRTQRRKFGRRGGSPLNSAGDKLLRLILTSAHRLLRLTWFVRRPRTLGAHAFALTPEGKLVLVKLRYAPGWRLPGGGHGPLESAEEAVLRELREEIGLTGHGQIRFAAELEEDVYFKRDLSALLIVEDVRYQPRWSLEVEEVREFALNDLPADTAAGTLRWINLVRGRF